VKDGLVLVTVRAGEPHKGRIDVPGGFLGYGEDPIDGLKREVKEELDVTIEATVDDCVSMAVHRYGDEGEFVLALGFAARLIAGDPHPRDDVADARWVEATDLDDLDFAWPHDRELVRKALSHGYG
jgi:8-oxo-dGTP diphosphatase